MLLNFLPKYFFFSVWFNKTKVHNANVLFNAIENRRDKVPLLTISNHHSCFDDPGLWGM